MIVERGCVGRRRRSSVCEGFMTHAQRTGSPNEKQRLEYTLARWSQSSGSQSARVVMLMGFGWAA